ncbi:MAG: hypothetical protein ACI92Z_000166 [Paracoccaceae bacterium]|jgi:hypothetical protein
MLQFRTNGGANFSYTADFSLEKFANISFFGGQQTDILFHLSLRGANSLAATNVRRDGEWEDEKLISATFSPTSNTLEVVFDETTIQILLDGAEILSFKGDYPGLEDIRYVNWTGAVVADSVELSGDANSNRTGMGELKPMTPIGVWGWAYDPAKASQKLSIEIEGLKEQPKIIPDRAPKVAERINAHTDRIAMFVALPGRVWQAADKDGVLTIRAFSNGIPCGEPLKLSRVDVLKTIESLATKISPKDNSFAAISIIEHVRFGKFFDELSENASTFVLRTASLYGLHDYLFPDANQLPEQPSEKTATLSASDILVDRIRHTVSAQLRENPGSDIVKILRHEMKVYPLQHKALKALILSLVEPACQSGSLRALYKLGKSLSLNEWTPGDNAWANSRLLPFLYLDGNISSVATILKDAAKNNTNWMMSPAIGWTIQQMIEHENSPWDDKYTEAVLKGFMTLTERVAQSYWRLPCQGTTKAVIALLAQSDHLPDMLAQQVRRFALRTFGLSDLFWQLYRQEQAAGRILSDADSNAARAAFETIKAYSDGKKVDIETALAVFDALDVIEAPRVRRELLGPAGCVHTDKAETVYGNIRGTGQGRGDTAMRYLAFPNAEATNADLAATSRTALQARWNNVEKAPYYQVQIRSSRGLHGLLQAVQQDEPAEQLRSKLTGLVPYLRRISGQSSGFLGLSLTLLAIESLIRFKAAALADQMLANLNHILSDMPSEMRSKVTDNPGVQNALIGIDQLLQHQDSDTLRATLELLAYTPDDTSLYPESIQGPAAWADRSRLFNTVVTVFSCKPYLESRIPPLRTGWLSDLAALGIPYIIVIGDGDGRIEGDIVHLDAPDDYEGLPQKSLAAVEWVYKNTTFDYMLKIDDDCFLNVDEYFHSQTYRKFHYYGRELTRELGAMNRCWHHEKSRSQAARDELDKSPEPSSYADGGGGYALSRTAMRALLVARDSANGGRLVNSSFMEDKMVGDLLAMENISVDSEDYYTSIWRRTHGPAQPVMMWDNYFFPSAASPCKMIHLDTEHAQMPAHTRLRSDTLYPKKLWPCFQSNITVGYNSNQLELMSQESDLARLNKTALAVICACRNEMHRLPAFLAHYRKLGVKCFLFVDNMSNDGSREYLLKQKDCVTFSADTHYKAGRCATTWQITVLANLRVGSWSLIADVDELLVYPGWDNRKTLPAFVKSADKGVDAFRVQMIDMYPKGPLEGVDLSTADPFAVAGFTDRTPVIEAPLFGGAFSNDRTLVSAVRHRLLPDSRAVLYVAQKYALIRYKPWMRLSDGLHYGAELSVAPRDLIFAHFKYDAHFLERAQTEAERGQHFNKAEEYRKYLTLEAEDGSAPVFYDPQISVPWHDSHTARQLLVK